MILLAGSSACSSGRPGLDVSYSVNVWPDGAPDVAVTMRVGSGGFRSLDLVGCAEQGVLLVHGLTASEDGGASIPVTTRFDSVDSRGKRITVPRYTLGPCGPHGATIRYRITLGKREGDPHLGFTGRTFGYNGPDFGFTTGRQIFLIPDRGVPVRRIAVRFLLPEDLRIAAPWRRDGDSWNPAVGGIDPREPLVAGAVAWGRLETRAVSVGGTKYRFVYDGSRVDGPSDRDIERLRRSARYVRDIFGRDLGREYVVVLATATPDQDEIVGEGCGTGQGGTLLPVGGRTLHTFASRLIDAYVLHPPYRATLRDPSRYWLVDAVREWYAWRAVEAAGLTDAAGIDDDLANGYLALFDAHDVDRNLEALYPTRPSSEIVRRYVAPLVLRYLDFCLRKESPAGGGVDPLLPRLFDPRKPADLWDLLPGGRATWARFRRDYVQGADIVPVSTLRPLAPTHARPSGKNGPLRKTITVMVTGNTHGFLETCGCRVNQSGGIARRATILERTRHADPEALLLDAGNFSATRSHLQEPDQFARLEQRFYVEMMDQARYAAAALGSSELALGYEALRRRLHGLRTPFLAVNIETRSGERPVPSVVLRSHGVRVGVVGVLEPPRGRAATAALDGALAEGVVLRDPVAAAAAAASGLRRRTDIVIVMGELRPFTVRRLIHECPEIDMVVSTRYDAPVGTWNRDRTHLTLDREDRSGFIGGTLVLYTTLDQYGIHRARIGLDADDRIVGADLEKIWLRDSISGEPGVERALSRFYEAASRLAGSGAVRGPLAGHGWNAERRYVGARRCAECHEPEYRQWQDTPHASAFKTLLERHRHFQPRCVSCHVVGYEEPTGFRLGDKEEPLGNVQCEVCHGPGGAHADDPAAANIARLVPERLCLLCHNEDHSSAFEVAERIHEVDHGTVSDDRRTASAR